MTDSALTQNRERIDRAIQGKTLANLLLQNATVHPEAPALSWKESNLWHTLSWSAYRQKVLEIAGGIKDLGLERGARIAIMAANRVEHVLAFMGAIHAGCTPTTLYNTISPEQIHYIAQDCQAQAAILENREYLEKWLANHNRLPLLKHLVLIEDAEDFQNHQQVLSWAELISRGRKNRSKLDECWKQPTPADPATIIYTSGTTGPPKGVILSQHNCLWEAASLDRVTNLPNGFTNVSYLPLAHIAEQLLSIYVPLQKVSHVYFCPDVKKALEYVQQARPFFFFGVPRVWEKMRTGLTSKIHQETNRLKSKLALRAIDTGLELVKHRQHSPRRPIKLLILNEVFERVILSKIRQAIGLDRCKFAASAAAPLPVDVAEFFTALGLPIYEVYGMTETTGVATGNQPGKIKIGSVGPSLPGVEVKLAEDNEILVRGPNCTAGYLNLAEVTAETIDPEGWVHTGDIGRLDADDYLWIIDRKKELIITAGGKNISPSNIENMLKEHPLIGQAITIGDGMRYLVALIVLDGEAAAGWAKNNGIDYRSIAELAQHELVQKEVDHAVHAANTRLARVEQIKRYRILPTEWTAESEELTPTMKLKRRIIHQKYKKEIEELYQT